MDRVCKLLPLLLSLFVPGSLSLTNTRSCYHEPMHAFGRGRYQYQCHGRSTTKRTRTTFLEAATTTTTTTQPNGNGNGNDRDYDKDIAEQEEKFKIVTCSSTACSKKRRSLGLDSLSTFGAMYARASEHSSRVRVEEGTCIGSCKRAPCVAVEHDDYFGTVALDGMTSEEFSSDAFLNIVTEEDADRVWSCVENAVKLMAEAEEDEDSNQS